MRLAYKLILVNYNILVISTYIEANTFISVQRVELYVESKIETKYLSMIYINNENVSNAFYAQQFMRFPRSSHNQETNSSSNSYKEITYKKHTMTK